MFPNVETNKIRYKSELKFKLIEKKRQIKNLYFSPNYALRFAAYIHNMHIAYVFLFGASIYFKHQKSITIYTQHDLSINNVFY